MLIIIVILFYQGDGPGHQKHCARLTQEMWASHPVTLDFWFLNSSPVP